MQHPIQEIPKAAEQFRARLRGCSWEEVALVKAIFEGVQRLVLRGGAEELAGVFEVESDSAVKYIECACAVYDEIADRQSHLDGVSDRCSR